MKNKSLLILAAYIICVALVLAATYIGPARNVNKFIPFLLIIAGGIGAFRLIKKENARHAD